MTSDEFYMRYLSGKMEDSKDFVEWAGDYQYYIALKQELENKLKLGFKSIKIMSNLEVIERLNHKLKGMIIE